MTARREIRCAWIAPSEDPDAQLLVPGCMERVQDCDAPCTCKTSAQELDELEARVAELEAELDRERDRSQSWSGVALRHPDSAALFAQADESFRKWRQMKDAVRRQNEESTR
jgi:hypothetical protein